MSSHAHARRTAHDHAAHDDHGPAKGIVPLADDHEPQGHRHDVPGVQPGHVLRRRLRWRSSSAPSCSCPACSSSIRGFFNTMTTMHALVMVFGAVMPATVGLANWMIPMQIGAPDMALPRMNNFSFWLLVVRVHAADPVAVRAGRRARPAAGRCIRRWCCRPATRFPLAIFAIHLMGASSIMGSINIIVTIMNMRAPGMTLLKMPLFVLDVADHRLPADRRDAGVRGRGDDAAHRPLLPHHASSPRRAAATR